MKIASLYEFMRAREYIRLRKEAGDPWPWTEDVILQKYKFTNVHREHDRTTRQFNDEFYSQHQDSPMGVQLLNCAMFRYFGTIEFARSAGWQRTFRPGHLKNLAKVRLSEGKRVFTGAYRITTGGMPGPKHNTVVDRFLAGVWEASDDLVRIMRRTKSWEATIERLSKVRGFGGTGFMAKEVILDTMFTSIWDELPEDYNTWCPAGPGARRGINRLREDRATDAGMTPQFALERMLEIFTQAPKYWPEEWPALSLHDIQFQLCEFDKYERTRLGEGRPRSRYQPPQPSGDAR